jgi:hypothetical protein
MAPAATAATAAVVLVLLVLLVLMLARMLVLVGDHALERFLGATVQFLVADIGVWLAFSHRQQSNRLSP